MTLMKPFMKQGDRTPQRRRVIGGAKIDVSIQTTDTGRITPYATTHVEGAILAIIPSAGTARIHTKEE